MLIQIVGRTLPRKLTSKLCLKSFSRHKLTSTQVRKIFLDYFILEHNHLYVPSSSSLSHGDNTLLFTNAGMNQFKAIFLDNYTDVYFPNFDANGLKRAVNNQKCIRIGGKHNDFDDVGKDSYHHTFFEMLGNWSFGDYFKEDACKMAFNLLTQAFKIPRERLYFTYFGGDEHFGLKPDLECREIWRKIGVPADRLLPFGMKDNFWDMGGTGPCGPCTEIHYSHLPINEFAASLVNTGNQNVIELWNLVFMQYCKKTNGSLEKLRQHHVDTGMGFERLVAVLNQSVSNYDTDLFQPLFTAIQKDCGSPPYGGKFGEEDINGIDTAYRIIADHARMAAVSIADGLIPDEFDAGHCLRKVIRRATMELHLSLKSNSASISKLIPVVSSILGQTFDNIPHNLDKIIKVVSDEEQKFLKILNRGTKLFKKMSNNLNMGSTFPVKDMWELYFVHGVPEDVILNLISSKGLVPELGKFYQQVTEEKLKSQKAYQQHLELKKGSQVDVNFLINYNVPKTNDSYKYIFEKHHDKFYVPDLESTIVAIWDGNKFVKEIHSSEKHFSVITKETNFYAEAGGQVADLGKITSKIGDHIFDVSDVYVLNGYVIHYGTLMKGQFFEEDAVTLKVDPIRRECCMRHHTSTHLLNSVLRRILGKVDQRSSKVSPDSFKFDFTFQDVLNYEKLAEIEKEMLEAIKSELDVKRILMPFSEAINLPGLVTVPGESYPIEVAVIGICDKAGDENKFISLEACCGTHVMNTKELQDFVILSQKSGGQSVRSLKAVAGPEAVRSRELSNDIQNEVSYIMADYEAKDKSSINFCDYDRRLVENLKRIESQNLSIVSRENLKRQVEESIRKINKLIRAKVKTELNNAFPNFGNENVIVYVFETMAHHQIVFSEAVNFYRLKPCFWFVKNGDKLRGRCLISKAHASDQFNAELWAQIIINNWKGVGMPDKKFPTCDYRVEMDLNTENIANIVESVKEFGNKIFLNKNNTAL